jgi:TRAP-type C4-dicarboxylate transport system substrate-binding protein
MAALAPAAAGTRTGSERGRLSLHAGARQGVPHFSKLVPEIAALSLPFAFENYDQAKRRAMAGVADDVRTWIGAEIVNKVLAANAPAMGR